MIGLPMGVSVNGSRRLLVLDTSYSLETIRLNKLEDSVTCRDLDGYFERVWTVHPFATLVTSAGWSGKYGRPVTSPLAARHVFIEGKVGRFAALAALPPINFCLAQGDVLFRLVRLVRDNQISVVRAGDPLLMGLYGWAIARLCGIPFVVRVAGNYELIRQQTGRPLMPRLLRSVRVERAIERFVLSRADLVAAANEDNLRYAMAMGASRERATVFRYGNLVNRLHFVDPALRTGGTEALAQLGLGGRRFLLCVSRLEPVKMPDHAVRSLALVRAQGMDVALLMVGGGSMRPELEILAKDLGVADHVIFAGERNQEWLAGVIPQAAVALSPITGRALSELALAGAPTVAYDIDWQGELIRSGVTGHLVKAGDVAAMARAAAGLLADAPQARRLGGQLRAAALTMMDPERLDEHERTQYTDLFVRFGVAQGAISNAHS
ncbi:MAG TPA: glycosyltransferase [Vicinamibacterales bacterium]